MKLSFFSLIFTVYAWCFTNTNEVKIESLYASFHQSSGASKDKKNKIGFVYYSEKKSFGYHHFKEDKNSFTGKGDYWVSTHKEAAPVFLQAPHKYHDLKTKEILLKILKSKKIKFAATNSMHRYDGKIKNYDLAHLSHSFLMNETKNFLKYNPKGWVVQLHGFNSQSRKHRDLKKANMIVSSGTRRVYAKAQKIKSCFANYQSGVFLYGKEINQLGGTTNTIGRHVNSVKPGRFIHLEMSKSLRLKLMKNNFLFEKFVDCLGV